MLAGGVGNTRRCYVDVYARGVVLVFPFRKAWVDTWICWPLPNPVERVGFANLSVFGKLYIGLA